MNEKISWYPGHIAKARQEIRKMISKIDIVVEILDARAPESTRSGIFSEKKPGKFFTVYSKCDLVHSEILGKMRRKFNGENVFFISPAEKGSTARVFSGIKKIADEETEKLKRFGFRKKTLSAMVVGMPNVGKTRFIKEITGSAKLRIENRPGVTRAGQWIRKENIQILDTPGVLYPEFSNIEKIYRLAFINVVDPVRAGLQEVLKSFWNFCSEDEREMLCAKYFPEEKCQEFEKFTELFSERTGIETIENIALRIISDYNKGSFPKILLDRIFD